MPVCGAAGPRSVHGRARSRGVHVVGRCHRPQTRVSRGRYCGFRVLFPETLAALLRVLHLFPPQRFPERHAFGRLHLLRRVLADGCQGRRARLLPANVSSRPRVHGVGAPWPRAGVFHLVGFPGNPSIVPQTLQQVLDAFLAEVHRGIVWKIVEASSGMRARCAGAACIPRHFRQGIARRQARCGSLGMAGRNRHRWRGLPAAPVRGGTRARRRGFRYSPGGGVFARRRAAVEPGKEFGHGGGPRWCVEGVSMLRQTGRHLRAPAKCGAAGRSASPPQGARIHGTADARRICGHCRENAIRCGCKAGFGRAETAEIPKLDAIPLSRSSTHGLA